MGRVFDVERGRRHYGPGGSYNIFAGRDASTSFITGKFEVDTDEALDDVLTLSGPNLLALWNWKEFYEKDYPFVGKLVGRHYDDKGRETAYYGQVVAEVGKAEADRLREERERAEFPPCNTEWSAETGSTFWCSEKSGGIERDWVGVPRRQFKPGGTDFNCVCVHESKRQAPNLKEFEDCDPESTRCSFLLEE